MSLRTVRNFSLVSYSRLTHRGSRGTDDPKEGCFIISRLLALPALSYSSFITLRYSLKYSLYRSPISGRTGTIFIDFGSRFST